MELFAEVDPSQIDVQAIANDPKVREAIFEKFAAAFQLAMSDLEMRAQGYAPVRKNYTSRRKTAISPKVAKQRGVEYEISFKRGAFASRRSAQGGNAAQGTYGSRKAEFERVIRERLARGQQPTQAQLQKAEVIQRVARGAFKGRRIDPETGRVASRTAPGSLKKSISITDIIFTTDGATGTVTASVPYAWFQEVGFRHYGKRGGRKIKGRRYLGKALDEVVQNWSNGVYFNAGGTTN